MADLGLVESLITGFPQDQRPVHQRIWQHVLKLSKMRFGRVNSDEPEVSQNMGGGLYTGTTPSVANEEFSILHNFDQAPYLIVPVLGLDQVGQKIVPLEVSRAADSRRIYLKSSETDAPFAVYVEG